jgi:hypothetical protein
MDFKHFLENYLEEDANFDLEGVFFSPNDNLIGLFKILDELKTTLDNNDTSVFDESILGVLQVQKNSEENCLEINKIHAIEKNGPLLYLLGMKVSNNKGLMPYHDPSYVSKDAKKVWHNFYEGTGKDLVTREKLSKDYHKEEYLNYKYFITAKTNKDKFSNLKKHIDIGNSLISNDKHGEKKDLIVGSLESFVQNKMRDIY